MMCANFLLPNPPFLFTYYCYTEVTGEGEVITPEVEVPITMVEAEEEGEAAAMEALESRLLSMRDIPDPYGVRVDARSADRVSPSP